MTGYPGNPTPAATTPWAVGTQTAGNLVVPTPQNGMYYKAQNSGTSSGSQPAFPINVGGTVTDAGGVTWVCMGSVPNENAFVVQEPVDGVDDVDASTVDGSLSSVADEIAFIQSKVAWLDQNNNFSGSNGFGETTVLEDNRGDSFACAGSETNTITTRKVMYEFTSTTPLGLNQICVRESDYALELIINAEWTSGGQWLPINSGLGCQKLVISPTGVTAYWHSGSGGAFADGTWVQEMAVSISGQLSAVAAAITGLMSAGIVALGRTASPASGAWGPNSSYLGVIGLTGALTLTLPSGTAGQVIIVKDEDGSCASHSCTISPPGGGTIDGGAGSVVLSSAHAKAMFVCSALNTWGQII